MNHMITRSIIISLVIILLGIISIMQINNDFISNVKIETGASKSIENINSLGTVTATLVILCIFLLILSLPKKKIATKKKSEPKKAKKTKRRPKKKR